MKEILARIVALPSLVTRALVVTAAIGIPIRCYLLSAVSFDIQGLRAKFSKLFPAILVLDGLWRLSPVSACVAHRVGDYRSSVLRYPLRGPWCSCGGASS